MEVTRTYWRLIDSLAAIGGLVDIFPVFVVIFYYFYNNYKMVRCMILKVVIGDERFYPEDYKLKKNFCRIYFINWVSCCCLCCRKAIYDGKDRVINRQVETFNLCNQILDDRTDIRNYVQDSMDVQIIRGLLLKSRHKLLMPLLALNLTKRSLELSQNSSKKKCKQQSSFMRNIYEADDMPVFDVETAVKALGLGVHKNQLEKQVDDFFLKHLPKEILTQNTANSDSARGGLIINTDLRRSVFGNANDGSVEEMIMAKKKNLKKPRRSLFRASTFTN